MDALKYRELSRDKPGWSRSNTHDPEEVEDTRSSTLLDPSNSSLSLLPPSIPPPVKALESGGEDDGNTTILPDHEAPGWRERVEDIFSAVSLKTLPRGESTSLFVARVIRVGVVGVVVVVDVVDDDGVDDDGDVDDGVDDIKDTSTFIGWSIVEGDMNSSTMFTLNDIVCDIVCDIVQPD